MQAFITQVMLFSCLCLYLWGLNHEYFETAETGAIFGLVGRVLNFDLRW